MSIGEKWQKKWKESKIFEANVDSREKFYTTVAFPYPNSPFHLGHGRTYVTADIYARYMRMKGYNVLFPMGFHYTGTPIITMADDVAKGEREVIDIFKNIYEIPDQVIPKLSDPLFMANYFKDDIKKAMDEMGLSIDWRREFTTIDPEFSSFIVWQFNTLQKRGFVVKDTHPVGWCPVHHLPVGMHDTKGDMEPDIGEYTLIFFESKSGYLPAATLRPETIFGVVAIWVNPKEKYVIAEVKGRKVILSERSAFKLTFQIDNVKVLEKISGSELTKITAINPVTGDTIPILGADFVDVNTATGIVMSVPAHAPFDYFYLKKVSSSIRPIAVVQVDGYNEFPAVELVEKSNPKNDTDLKKLTEQLYRIEYNKGRMRKDAIERSKEEFRSELGSVIGISVPEARKSITDFLISHGLGDKIYEIMNKPVYCRCGNEVVVKILKDQWFLDYGNPEWKALVRKLVSKMRLVPDEVRKDFEYSIEWLQKRACARTRGLGTPLPWDKKWIIESLSDSTIYMAYYTIAHKIKTYKLRASQMTFDFWDYVLLGKGDINDISKLTGISIDVLQQLRSEFMYWYPLDMRHSGSDLIPNHLSFFIFNHAAIFPEDLWPRGIAVNGLVLYEGKKMSKSLRNIIPLRKTIRIYGPDVIRITLSSLSDMGSEANFTDAAAKSVMDSLKRFYEIASSISSFNGNELGFAEKWLMSRLNSSIKQSISLMDNMRFRDANNLILFGLLSDVNEYMEMVKAEGRDPNGSILRDFVIAWTRLLAPFAPHIAEEVWNALGNSGFVSVSRWPNYDESNIDLKLELEHEYHKEIIDDIRSILNVYKGNPKIATIYVANTSEHTLLMDALKTTAGGGTLKTFMSSHRPKNKEEAKELQDIFEYATEMSDSKKKLLLLGVDEEVLLKEGLPLIKYKTGLDIEVQKYSDEIMRKYKKESFPLRPSIVLS
ncbi:leucine--tRNA ligase [Acidianus sp. RZ1]|uniref:leucine--tRNA ligase n=1 Tax=Acidianus sp. RZ1 TaxID=1540082 RepID=UPI0014929395|nr:leucine--tRNA ligase [Acidianus sp. RZ1]NON62598.1 leucine--tRNA ligase [Acidianus sp. RZ1]